MAEIEYTPNLALAKQPTGAREWGTVLNENFDKIDAELGQIGIKNYSDTETYAVGEFVIAVIDDQVGIYKSLQSGNIGHLLTDESWWEAVPLGTREIELNNPFSLLDYKWSEYELNNASWLLSNGAFHSGTVYKSVYELLLKIHNGTETKEGVSVKLSTEAYEDTDFVLNTVDTTFRLPIKVKLASGNVVVGNGMTLGLTNGQFNFGLRNGSTIGFFGQGGAYGTNVGTSVSGNVSSMEVSVGVTTDSLKSGIETSSNGLKLYFYVGETIQDANVINASGVLTRVAELSDGYISGLGMPSDKSVTLTLGATGTEYTAPANGWFVVQIKSTGSTKGCYVYMRNSTTGLVTRDYNYHPSTSTDMTVVTCCSAKKGEKVLINYDVAKTISFSSLEFIYAKGEN